MLRSRKDSHRDFLRSQSIVRKRRKKNLFRISLRIFFLTALFAGVIFVLRLDSLQIKKVVVVGSDSLTTEKIREMAEEKLAGQYMYTIPKHNTLFYPKKNIEAEILQNEPHIKGLSMSTEGFDILNIKLTERIPVMKWCSEDTCFNIDDTSFVYSQYESGELVRIQGGSLGSSTNPIRQTAFEENTFKTIKDTVSALASSSLSVLNIEYKTPDQIEYRINGNGYVIVSGKRPLEESMGNLDAALKSSRFSTSTQFEYIDTRFGNKVFFKVKESSKGSSTASSTHKH